MADIIKDSSGLIQNSFPYTEDDVKDSGRDSGIAESPRSQEANAKKLVLSSHKELQEAKQKLEELRLLRFEEKSLLRDEIDTLHEKVNEEERNASVLEDQVKTIKIQNDKQIKKLEDLEKEQTIGCQINMMQEQEIVRLEVNLKELELEKFSLSKQNEHQRRTIIEKDKLRIKQQKDIYILTEKVAQLEESNGFVKTENEDAFEKLKNSEDQVRSLKKELIEMNRELESMKCETSTSRLEMKQLKMSNKRLEDTLLHEREQLKGQIDIFQTRAVAQEEENHEREIILQQDLEIATLNEAKLTEKCEVIEQLYHETRRTKDEKDFEVKQYIERIRTLEEQLQQTEDLKTETEFVLTELQTVILKHTQTEVQSPKSGPKDMFRSISPEELDEYFENTSTKMCKLQNEVAELSTQITKEQRIMGDLNDTIGDVKSQLEKTRDNLVKTDQLKNELESQFQRVNETVHLKEQDIERKNDEIKNLHVEIQNLQRRTRILENNVESASRETSRNAQSHKEEKRKLKTKIQEMENNHSLLETSKIRTEEKMSYEQKQMENNLELKTKECHELKTELGSLIEDNKSLAQRLIHLESYSDKLGHLLEQHQSDSDNLKEKLQKEVKHKRTISEEKNMEISSLSQQLNDLNHSLNEKNEKNEKLGSKIRHVKYDQKALEKNIRELAKNNKELENRVIIITDAHTVAEKNLISKDKEVKNFQRRFYEQSKSIEELLGKIDLLESEKKTLHDELHSSEKRIKLKESLMVELSKKTSETEDNYNELKSSTHKTEMESRHYEYKLSNLQKDNKILEKSIRESEDERLHMKEQISHLRKLLQKAEDEKDKSFSQLSILQNELETEKSKRNRFIESEHAKQQHKFRLDDLQSEVTTLRDELELEKRRRQRLESLYSKRDGQVTKLRSTFDQSLNAITNDTKNIKNILGKSLQKIDRQMKYDDGLVSDSDVTEPDTGAIRVASYSQKSPPNSSSDKYLNLSHSQRTKSLDSMDTLDKIKFHSTPITTHRSFRSSRSPVRTSSSSILLPSSKPQLYDHEIPTRDISNARRSKRLTR